MTPGARLQAVVELLESLGKGGAADAVAASYFRGRRFFGSKDRAEVARRYYGLLRRRARLGWWIDHVLERPADAPPAPARFWVLADLMLTDRRDASAAYEMFDGGPYRPAALSRAERTLVDALQRQPLEHPDMPRAVRQELPEWILPDLDKLFPGDEAEIAALNVEAPLDLRVNPLLTNREEAQAALTAAEVDCAPTELSPLGLRVRGRPALGHLPPFQKGMIEIQDEGSQIVALLADARPGYAVIDYCAGAGGKTLALAGQMQNKGRLIACDISAQRLERAVLRLRRAGVHNVERRPLDDESKGWLKRQAGRFDRVLVDAPCSGTGTWRRNPDMKWRIGPTDVEELTALQTEILANAAKLAKPGGRVIYATCSLLTVENEGVVEAFLAAHPDFSILPVTEIWGETVGGVCPVPGPFLRLSPGAHGTDGFFAAVLTKAPPVAASAPPGQAPAAQGAP